MAIKLYYHHSQISHPQVEVAESLINPTFVSPLQASPPEATKQGQMMTNTYSDPAIARGLRRSLPDINDVRNTKMLKDLANMKQLKERPWDAKEPFMPLTAKELVKFGHVPPLPG